MIWDTSNRPNLLACAQKLEAEGFNVRVTPLQLRGTTYCTVCALGEVEEHLLRMVVDIENTSSLIDPEELLVNAETLRAANEEIHQSQMLTSVIRVTGYKCNPEIARAVISRLDPDSSCPLEHWAMRDAVLLQAQQEYLAITLKQAISSQQSQRYDPGYQ
jgi:CMP-N-acetylneuraminic acid synthetase